MNNLRIIGANPQATVGREAPVYPIATIFPHLGTLVNVMGVHAMQRARMIGVLQADYRKNGWAPLTDDQIDQIQECGVDLFIDRDCISIRPEKDKMDLAFEADKLLQTIVPKWRIRFMHLHEPAVHDAIKRRGELWRITPPARTIDEMKREIAESRIAIGGQPIYYYCPSTGTRWLTLQMFGGLEALGDDELREHLNEIREFANRRNRLNYYEVDFFLVDHECLRETFGKTDWQSFAGSELRSVYVNLKRQFAALLPPQMLMWGDDPDDPDWRWRMYSTIKNISGWATSEEQFLRLSPEFFLHVQWLASGRIDRGQIIYDPVFEEESCPDRDYVCDDKVRRFIANLTREYDLEYINMGRIIQRLCNKRSLGENERRAVYVACFKRRGVDSEEMKILRLQKWGPRERLNQNKSLECAMLESEEYVDYCQDRRLGARRLGMHMPCGVVFRRIAETYKGTNDRYRNMRIYTPYTERDYVKGLASDKIPEHFFHNDAFAITFARLLGEAAGPNLIVGRCDDDDLIFFDDGDEVLVFEGDQVPTDVDVEDVPCPTRIIVTTPTASFNNFTKPLAELIDQYANAILERLEWVNDPTKFIATYIEAFRASFLAVQEDYLRQRQAYHGLFSDSPCDGRGNFPDRWLGVLARLAETNVDDLEARLRACFPQLVTQP